MLLIAYAACACGYSSATEKPSSNDSEIFQAAVASTAASAGNKYLVVASEPHAVRLEQEWVEAHLASAGKVEVIPVIPRMIADYEKRNAKDHLPASLGSLNVRFVSAQTLAQMFAGDVLGGWKRFWVEYPGAAALLELSLPGYSPDKTWAILSYSVSRGSLAGEFWVALLHQKAGVWIVEWTEILTQS
jgi:hypothetical protein